MASKKLIIEGHVLIFLGTILLSEYCHQARRLSGAQARLDSAVGFRLPRIR